MTWLLKILAGKAGIWVLLAGGMALFAAGTVTGHHIRGVQDAPVIAKWQKATAEAERQIARCQATHQKARADGAEEVITALLKAAAAGKAAMEEVTARERARARSLQDFVNEVRNAPSTRVCGASAPERAYRVRVQAGRGAPAP